MGVEISARISRRTVEWSVGRCVGCPILGETTRQKSPLLRVMSFS